MRHPRCSRVRPTPEASAARELRPPRRLARASRRRAACAVGARERDRCRARCGAARGSDRRPRDHRARPLSPRAQRAASPARATSWLSTGASSTRQRWTSSCCRWRRRLRSRVELVGRRWRKTPGGGVPGPSPFPDAWPGGDPRGERRTGRDDGRSTGPRPSSSAGLVLSLLPWAYERVLAAGGVRRRTSQVARRGSALGPMTGTPGPATMALVLTFAGLRS